VNSGVITLPPHIRFASRSLAGHLEYLEWAAAEVVTAFR